MAGSNYTLLISCPDRPGLVAAVAAFLVERDANIVHADQHVDRQENLFLQRIEFTLPRLDSEKLREEFTIFSLGFDMTWSLRTPDRPRRVAVLTSTESHCLSDLLSRWDIGEMDPAELAFVASNHPDHADLVHHHGVPFHHIPVNPENRESHGEAIRQLCADNEVDLLILARYMQIIGEAMVNEYRNRIVNIHHSFLPAFAGARPYHQAHARGVKLIGATAHYVTSELDEGPIIAQDVLRVSHRDGIEELRQKGRDLEKVVLARAVRLHLNDRILAYGNRTAVFD
ncbi:MAG: formyltetrahydrofolate deformylase [Acidimicrobiia bacterium]